MRIFSSNTKCFQNYSEKVQLYRISHEQLDFKFSSKTLNDYYTGNTLYVTTKTKVTRKFHRLFINRVKNILVVPGQIRFSGDHQTFRHELNPTRLVICQTLLF